MPAVPTGTLFSVATTFGSNITVTAVTNANPAVCTATAHGLSNGDVIEVTSGWGRLNKRVFEVANVATNTFELEGEDTTDYQTFVSGSFQVITFGASLTIAQNIAVSGGDTEFADVTTIHDLVRKRVPTIVSPMSLAMDNIFDLTDPGFIELNKAHKSKTKRAIRLRFGTGAKMVLTGYASAAGVPTGQAQGVVQMKMAIEAQNLPTVYAS